MRTSLLSVIAVGLLAGCGGGKGTAMDGGTGGSGHDARESPTDARSGNHDGGSSSGRHDAGSGGKDAGSTSGGQDTGSDARDARPGALDTGAVDGGPSSPYDSGLLTAGRPFPDTTATISILADQIPGSLPAAQVQFTATHYVGTQKQLLPDTQALRAVNPNFLVLHYHLSMWQSAPAVDFITNGVSWGNDYPTVTLNESWFWHNTSNQRVWSSVDQKLLMDITVPAFEDYWATSLEQQVVDGQYDAIFFDSASPAILQAECGGTGANQDPRLEGTNAASMSFADLGNTTWIDAWQTWMAALSARLGAEGIPLIPNDDAFITGWDTTNYGTTAGVFSEGFAGTGFAVTDWEASTNELLTLVADDKIVILQNYLSTPDDTATRLYYLGNYLLVKGQHTYLDYFANGPLEWYPEWTVDLGAPTTPAPTSVAGLLTGGVYRRDFANGSVLVNPTSSSVTVALGATFQQVVPTGGGAVDAAGDEPGSLSMEPVTSVVVGATTAVIVLK